MPVVAKSGAKYIGAVYMSRLFVMIYKWYATL